MLQNKKSLFSALILLFAGAAILFADLPDEIVDRQVSAINEAYEKDDINTAYTKINALLSTYSDATAFPGKVTYLAQNIYAKYLDRIEKAGSYSLLDEIEANLKAFSGISSPRLTKKLISLRSRQAAAKEQKSEAQQKAMLDSLQSTSESTVKAIQENSERTSEILQQQSEIIQQNSTQTAEALKTISEGNNAIGSWIKWVLIGLAILGLLIFLIFFFMAKSQAQQTAQFDATLKLVAGMQQANNQLLLGNITDFGGMGNLRLAGASSTWGQNALPAPEMNEEEKAELKKLAIDCEDLGMRVDQVSKRKNNSKNVSELVYKLAMRLGLNQNTSMVYFCAAMVYDAGFLNVSEEILSADSLTDEQREELRKHVSQTEGTFDFVPEKWRNIFEDAALYHHENMDGSGYPQGLKDENIPQIARLIHVAESYNSLISRRNYRQIQDKDSAIEELKSKPEFYDKAVVEALDAIV